MPVSINTNTSATLASQNLSKSNSLLQKSLQRLSSGSKIASASDDAGGLAVSLRLEAALKRTAATTSNVSNAISFLQTQDGSLGNLSNLLARMAELRTLASDVTKTTGDITNYYTEFTALQAEFSKTMAESFNGISLFNITAASTQSATSLIVNLSEDGSQTMTITTHSLNSSVLQRVFSGGANFSSVARFQTAAGGISTITAAISEIATDRATNGAQTSRLQFALDSLASNLTNLESANSRIVDVDVAAETTRLARNNILVQAGTAMLSQANASSQIALKLLQ
jgi:flagellin